MRSRYTCQAADTPDCTPGTCSCTVHAHMHAQHTHMHARYTNMPALHTHVPAQHTQTRAAQAHVPGTIIYCEVRQCTRVTHVYAVTPRASSYTTHAYACKGSKKNMSLRQGPHGDRWVACRLSLNPTVSWHMHVYACAKKILQWKAKRNTETCGRLRTCLEPSTPAFVWIAGLQWRTNASAALDRCRRTT